ncbi:MAG TPA: TadE/TadG family type IV pilus assembly protein [Syntrophorhabdales bacterium]|nr:TadE/TadG family type IV pilus assembly protein [Syntrophorhabdales bacterium]
MRLPRNVTDKRGFTIVEFALVLPVFALLLCAIMDFGHYFFVQHTLQYATREGTRLALVGATLNGPSGNSMTRQASIIQTIQNNAAVAVNPGTLQISIFPVAGPNYTNPANWQGMTNPGNGGDFMRVVVQYTFKFWTPFIGKFFPSGQQVITAQALYRNEMF